MKFINSRLLITILILIFLSFGTYLAINWAKGYRLNLKDQTINGTGLLVANSEPKGASIYINDKLASATDETLHLNPGDYDIKIEKEGYHTWTKTLKIEKELVRQTNAKLFPSAPDLSALTFNGASSPYPSPNGNKIAFKIASGSAEKKYGLWVLELSDNPLRQGNSAIQIAQDTTTNKFSEAQIFWVPNSNQVLAYFNENKSYILETSKLNKQEDLINVAFQLESLISDWQQQLALDLYRKIAKLPEQLQQIATNSATLLYFSPNEEKLLYTATNSGTLADNLVPPILSINSQPQQRQLTPGNIYVYDSEEDTNFLLKNQAFTADELEKITNNFSLPEVEIEKTLNSSMPTTSPITKKIQNGKTNLENLNSIQAQYSPIYSLKTLQWFPDSYHLISVEDNKVYIMEYDNTNKVPVYPGIFAENFTYPWPNGKKLILLSSLSIDPNVLSNFYALSLE